jgi:hypothetical protein
MTNRTERRDAKLEEQCAVVASLIVAMRPVYEAASIQQRALLETIIGAAIRCLRWLVPDSFAKSSEGIPKPLTVTWASSERLKLSKLRLFPRCDRKRCESYAGAKVKCPISAFAGRTLISMS